MYPLIALVLLLSTTAIKAQPAQPPINSTVAISLADGTRLEGTIINTDATSLTIAATNGLEVKVPRAQIAQIKVLTDTPRAAFSDPDNTRLIFAPTARPLRRGSGYFSNYYVFFPGISYGLKGLAVLVLGGLGSVPGAIVGGLVMGLAEALIPAAASGWRDALAFAILFAVLVLRPSGLLGRQQLEKV